MARISSLQGPGRNCPWWGHIHQLSDDQSVMRPLPFWRFKGTVVYNSFGEWLRSPYSRENTGKPARIAICRIQGLNSLPFPKKAGSNAIRMPLSAIICPGREIFILFRIGKVFVKPLEEKWAGVSPTAAYWTPTKVVMDTKIARFESDIGEFLFANPDSGDVRIEAVLIYRRAYKKLLEQKGIEEPDIVMESAGVFISQK